MHRRSNDSRRSGDHAPLPPNPNVFDDEYALDPTEEEAFVMPVADGRRPAGGSNGNERQGQEQDPSSAPRPPLTSANSNDSNDLRRLASHNSVAKAPYGRDSMSNDSRTTGFHHRGPSLNVSTPLRRQTSVSSNASLSTMAASDDPVGNGPSFAYGMYPQFPMSRTESVRTSSTQPRPPRPLSPQAPSHNYSIYPQNVTTVVAPLPLLPQAIPIGFPGHNAHYHRQLGPDGEEQDIIGPDGHTEQLPPYTRYPEEGPTKASLAAQESATPRVPPISTLSDPSGNTLQPSPISPLSTTPEAPFPQEQESGNSDAPALAPPPAIAGAATVQSELTLSSSEQGASEKPEAAEGAKSWRHRKLWGRIPVWVAILILLLFVILAVALGATLGTLLARRQNNKSGSTNSGPPDDRHHEEASPQVTGPFNTLFDATPIATPASLAPLPTGVYALPLGIAQESSPNCLPAPNQLPAWSCKMTFAPLVLSLTYIETEKENITHPVAAVGTPVTLDTDEASIQYGIQPPKLGENTMQLVSDLDLPRYGPAYHFAAEYDKLVILSEDDLRVAAGAASAWKASALRKRTPSENAQKKPPFRHRFKVMPGDTPWYCYWNKTYIEGYIYVENNSTAATFSNFPTAWPSESSSMAVETPSETATIASTETPSQTSDPESASPEASESAPTSIPLRYRDTQDRDSDSKRFIPYPRIVKIEERRLPGAPQPYCKMMQVLEDYSVVPLPGLDGLPIKIYLDEDTPPLKDFQRDESDDDDDDDDKSKLDSKEKTVNAIKRHDALLRARGDPADACHCQWMFQ